MKIRISNLGIGPVPVVPGSGGDAGVITELAQGESVDLDDADLTVVSVGDNPSFQEELAEGLAGFAAAIRELLDKLRNWWDSHNAKLAADEVPPNPVSIEIANDGPNALRVLRDSNLDETQVEPGAVVQFEASRYVEIRELGV